MSNKGLILKRVFTVFVVAIYLSLIAVLVLQALKPGSQSSDVSNNVGNIVDKFVTEIKKPEVEFVSVTKVEIQSLNGAENIEGQLTFSLGQGGKINCIVYPQNASNPTLLYSSSNENVATVSSNGRVQTVGIGTTTIKVSSAENVQLYSEISLAVIEVPVQAIQIVHLPSDFRVGQKHSLEISYTPSNCSQKSIAWSSSNNDVIKVNSKGVLTAVCEGQAIITATSLSNPNLTQTIEIEVLPKLIEVVVPVEQVIIDKSIQIGYVGQTGNFSVDFYPYNATDRVIWSSSDEEIATISQSGKATYYKAGTVRFEAKCSSYDITDCIDISVKEVLSSTIDFELSNLKKDDNGHLHLKIGSSGKIEALLDANATIHDVKFTSSNENVAKIGADGVIETVKAGTVTITATTNYDGKSTTKSIELTIDGLTFKDTVENFYHRVRKLIGHFSAFLILGIFAVLSYFMLFPKSTKGKLLGFIVCLIAGFAVAGITEILQLPIFTVGRGPSFNDVILDFKGYCYSCITMYAVIFAVHFAKIIYKKLRSKNTGDNAA
ncbi:MAG: VanZ family protein [Clostridia bacterium]|nr:VanZ family protein [Clostridia bacterium]